jgi:hypothetical protein
VAGCLALGASIGVVNDNSKINSIIDDNANISRADTFTVIASNNSNVQGLSVAPAVGINAGVSVYSYGSGMSDEDKKLLNVENQQSIDAYVNDYINKSNIENALDDYVGNTVASKVEQKVANRTLATNITNTSTNGNEGTAAKIGSGSNIASNGNVSVNATNSLASETNVGTGVAGCLALGASIAVTAAIISIDGLGQNGFPQFLGQGCWLDAVDLISEGILMPLAACYCAIVIPTELVEEEVTLNGNQFKTKKFYEFCIKFIAPIMMVIVLLGQLDGFLGLGMFG